MISKNIFLTYDIKQKYDYLNELVWQIHTESNEMIILFQKLFRITPELSEEFLIYEYEYMSQTLENEKDWRFKKIQMYQNNIKQTIKNEENLELLNEEIIF